MTLNQLSALDVDNLPANRLTALSYVRQMLAGDWTRTKEALDRDEGPIARKVEQKLDSDQPSTLIINRISGGKDKADLCMSSAKVRHIRPKFRGRLPSVPNSSPSSAVPPRTDPAG